MLPEMMGVVIVGAVSRTFPPVPVTEPKSVKPASQSVLPVPDVEMQVTISVICGGTVATSEGGEALTVRSPVELLTMWNVHPVVRVDVLGSLTVSGEVPVKSWYCELVLSSVVAPPDVAVDV